MEDKHNSIEINGIMNKGYHSSGNADQTVSNIMIKFNTDLEILKDKFKADLDEAIDGTGNYMSMDTELQMKIVKHLYKIVNLLDTYIKKTDD